MEKMVAELSNGKWCSVFVRNCNTDFKCKTHIKASIAVQTIGCCYCWKSFKQKYDFNLHQRTHTVVRQYKCDDCVNSFTTNWDLKEKTEVVVRPYKCDDCFKSFKQSSYLCRHQRIHTGVRPYKYDDFKKSFNNHLKQHRLIYAGVRSYNYNDCEKKFRNFSNLNVHKRIHNNDFYQCNVCDYKLKFVSKLINCNIQMLSCMIVNFVKFTFLGKTI